jgi:7,8-dihydroneopterin aldolase/epimerase/oxygenase
VDFVSVRDLSVEAVIGVHEWERGITQTLVFDVMLAALVARAARTDDLTDALDYSAVARTVASVVQNGQFRLIETAAERVAERLLADYPVAWLQLEVRKPIADGGYTAAVTIERGVRDPAG